MDKQQIRKIQSETYFRSLQIRKDKIDEEKRTVELSFSSEEPYERWWGTEILDHGKGSVKLDRMKNGAPFLVDHNTRDQVGVIEKAFIGSDRRGRAVVRFGRSGRAEEIFQDVIDGIRTKVSVGYQILKMVLEEEEEGHETFRVTSWRPYEASIVAVPADDTVGVGRSKKDAEQQTRIHTGVDPMNDEVKKFLISRGMDPNASDEQALVFLRTLDKVPAEVAAAAAPSAQAREAEVNPKELADLELKRMRDISTLGARFNMRTEADAAIANGDSVGTFQALILDRTSADNLKPITVGDPEIGMSKKELQQYSLFNVFRYLAFKDQPEGETFKKAAAFELDVHRAAAQKLGSEFKAEGILMPYDVYASRQVPFLHQRDLSAGTATDGQELVATNLMAGSFIDVLRNLSVVMAMGARPLTGLTGNPAIPRKTSGSSAGWVSAEGGDVSQSEPQFDQVTMSPKTLGAYAEITRQLLLQSSLDIENLVREDLAAGVATAIDLAALYGSGSSGQPTGVSQQTGINSPTAFAGAVPTWAEVVAMESAVAVDNALVGNLGYIIEPSMRGSFKTTEKFSSTGMTIWEPGNTVNGYKTGVTNQITPGDVFYGNWADLLIGFWGALDVLIDPYTNSLSGTLRIVAHESCDVAVRHPVSFAFNNDGV